MGLQSWLRLHLAQGVGAVTFRKLVEAFGSVEAVFAASPGQWMSVQGVGEKTAAAIANVTQAQVDDELAAAEKLGVRILTLDDADYPAGLRTLYDAPRVLYVRGRLEPADAVAVGVVGSRRCTHYGLEQGERFGQLLGRAGFTVVSGGARGIDTAAHRGALTAGGRTVAVMGCGLCHTYPPENSELFSRILAEGRGALVSELPMRTAVLPGNFPTRNRIISGMSLGILVVEAARRSGSLITAREAAEQGREVFAVPGRVDSPLSAGANDLIRNGAVLVQGLEDMLEHLGQVGHAMTDAPPPPADVTPQNLRPDEARLLDALSGGELALDDLVRKTALASGQVIASMTMLVLKGAVMQKPGNVFVRRKAGTLL